MELQLHLIEIKTRGLRHVEIGGKKNDPYVIITFACNKETKFSKQTPVIEDGGSDVEWNIDSTEICKKLDDSWILEITSEELKQCNVHVVVKDANKFRPDVLIGEGNSSLSGAQPGHEYITTITLLDKQQKNAGTVTLKLKVSPQNHFSVFNFLFSCGCT